MNKRLTKSSHNKVFLGICSGIAEYYGWEASHVRWGFALFVLLGGSGILLYFILWLVIPNY